MYNAVRDVLTKPSFTEAQGSRSLFVLLMSSSLLGREQTFAECDDGSSVQNPRLSQLNQRFSSLLSPASPLSSAESCWSSDQKSLKKFLGV